jgi:phenylacetate-CoA ligase
MDLIRPLVKHITHDAFLLRDGYHPGQYRKHLAASQFLSTDELCALQLEKLRRILAAANATHPFYRRRFQACGFEPGDLRGFADLERIPILTKDDVRGDLVSTLADGFHKRDVIHKRTGGSTGVPVHVFMDFDAASLKKAATERHNGWAGLFPGDRLAAVWGDTSGPLPWRSRLRNALTTRAFYLDTLRFEPTRIEVFIGRVRACRPRVLLGHAHSVFRLAEYVRDHAIEDVSFKGIITTAMVLSETERQVIEAVFRAPVYNRYGCEELSIIASECSAHQGMHEFAEGLYLELLGERQDLPRRLVITDLLNRAMPLIRYDIGDYGVEANGPCPCGRGLPRLIEVSGREADFLFTPDRVPVFGISILDTFVIHIPGIRQAQIIQDRYDHLELRIVREVGFGDESLALLRKNLREVFGDRMQYDICYVDRIEQTATGKYRFSICRIETGGTP